MRKTIAAAVILTALLATCVLSGEINKQDATNGSDEIFHPSIMKYAPGEGPRHFDAWHETPPAGSPEQPYLPYMYQGGSYIYWRQPDYNDYWQHWNQPHYRWQPDIETFPHTISHVKWVNVDWFAYDNNGTYRKHIDKMTRQGFRVRNPR